MGCKLVLIRAAAGDVEPSVAEACAAFHTMSPFRRSRDGIAGNSAGSSFSGYEMNQLVSGVYHVVVLSFDWSGFPGIPPSLVNGECEK